MSDRRVGCLLVADLDGEAAVELQVAAAGLPREEELVVELDHRPVDVVEHATAVGGRLHLLRAGPGRLAVRYSAVVGPAEPVPVEPLDAALFLRPSRYAESDRLAAVAAAEWGSHPAGMELVRAVAAWVGGRTVYEPGSSTGTDGAVDTLLAGEGVCRDFAHLVVGLLRARDVPARVVSAYAPGLSPMDFHAVAEVLVDDAWRLVDATRLAPRQSLVRIATGRDAADTAFLSSHGAGLRLDTVEVTAVVDGALPLDDHR